MKLCEMIYSAFYLAAYSFPKLSLNFLILYISSPGFEPLYFLN